MPPKGFPLIILEEGIELEGTPKIEGQLIISTAPDSWASPTACYLASNASSWERTPSTSSTLCKPRENSTEPRLQRERC